MILRAVRRNKTVFGSAENAPSLLRREAEKYRLPPQAAYLARGAAANIASAHSAEISLRARRRGL